MSIEKAPFLLTCFRPHESEKPALQNSSFSALSVPIRLRAVSLLLSFGEERNEERNTNEGCFESVRE